MEPLILFIPGDPMAKQRPRFTRSGRTYTPKKTESYESFVRWLTVQNMAANKLPMFTGSLRVTIYAYFQTATSWGKWKHRVAHLIGMTHKPDIDNVTKICLDALNGVAYHDDAMIVEKHVYKRWVGGDIKSAHVHLVLEDADMIPAQQARMSDFQLELTQLNKTSVNPD